MSFMGTLIFDMDGTLVDSMNQHAEIFSQILHEEFTIPPEFSRLEYFRTAGHPLDEQFGHVLRSSKNIEVFNIIELLERFWHLVQECEPVLFPDVPDAINQLWRAGYSLVVISNCAPFIVDGKMHKTGINQYFQLMLGTDKTIPDMVKGEGHFRIIQHELNLTHEQFCSNSTLIGDAEYDMELAKEASLIAIGRTTGNNMYNMRQAGADFLVQNLKRLICLLQSDSRTQSRFLRICELRTATHDKENNS